MRIWYRFVAHDTLDGGPKFLFSYLANSRARVIVLRPYFHERWPWSTVKVTDANFKSEVMGAGGPVVVDFWAEWCGPCKMIGPALEEIAKEMQGKVTIGKLNVDENPGVASTYGIRSIPTLMLFKDGKMASSKVGAAPKSELKKWITEAI